MISCSESATVEATRTSPAVLALSTSISICPGKDEAMKWKKCLCFGLAACLGGGTAAYAQNAYPAMGTRSHGRLCKRPRQARFPPADDRANRLPAADRRSQPARPARRTGRVARPHGSGARGAEVRPHAADRGRNPAETDLRRQRQGVEDQVSGWLDFDYTFRSTGIGHQQHRPGDEPLRRRVPDSAARHRTSTSRWTQKTGRGASTSSSSPAPTPPSSRPTAGGWTNTEPPLRRRSSPT